jgi:hypothetical protein
LWVAAALLSVSALVALAAPAGASTGPYDDAVLADGPSAFWRLDHATGDGTDETGTVPDGAATLCGTCAGKRGAIRSEPANTSVAFDGASIISFPGHLAALQPSLSWTVEAWIRLPTSATGTGYVYGFGGDISGQSLGVAGGQIVGRINVGCTLCDPTTYTLTSPNSYADHKWHLVDLVRDGAGGTFYLVVDGTRIATQAIGSTVTHYDAFSTSQPAIGGWHTGFGFQDYFRGSIDEVALYPTALSKARIRAHRAAA